MPADAYGTVLLLQESGGVPLLDMEPSGCWLGNPAASERPAKVEFQSPGKADSAGIVFRLICYAEMCPQKPFWFLRIPQ